MLRAFSPAAQKCPPAGFTLLELLAVLITGTVLALCSVPLTKHILSGNPLRHEAKNLQSTLEMLILTARQRESQLILEVFENHYLAYPLSAPQSLIAKRTLEKPAKIILSGHAQPKTLRFYPSGVDTPASLVLESGPKRCTVKISLRGRVTRLC